KLVEVQREAMKKADFLVGEWKGEGWVGVGKGQQKTFRVTESVQRKVSGLALLFQGLGKSKVPGSDQESSGHGTLDVRSYDPKAKLYRFRSHEANGRSLDAEAKVMDGGLEWGFRDPESGYSIRFTIRLTPKGEWFEIGEVSDGKAWYKVLEM